MQKTRCRLCITFICFLAFCCAFPESAPAQTSAGNVLYAKGHGTVTFQGTATISLNGEGTLVVDENTDVMFIREEESDQPEPECFPTEEGDCVYVELNGKVQLTGENIEISFTGANIGLNAGGNGTMVLTGYGIYIYIIGDSLKSGRWTITGTTIIFEN